MLNNEPDRQLNNPKFIQLNTNLLKTHILIYFYRKINNIFLYENDQSFLSFENSFFFYFLYHEYFINLLLKKYLNINFRYGPDGL